MKNILALAFVAAGVVANAQVIDFQSLEQNNALVNNVGNSYQEDGFSIDKTPGEPFEFASFGTQESRYAGSTGIFNNTVQGNIFLTKIGGGAFDVKTIDLAILNGSGTAAVNFVGDVQGGGQVFANFNISNTQFQAYTLNMNNIVKLSWVQDFDFHQFDNINTVPEPATMVALGAGIAAFVARRRK